MTATTIDPATPAWAADLQASATALRASIDALETTVLLAMKRRAAIASIVLASSLVLTIHRLQTTTAGAVLGLITKRYPSLMAPFGPGLPPIPYFAALWNPELSGQDLTTYLHGHGITAIPEEVEDRRILLARVLGVRFKDPSRASVESTESGVFRTY
ncbi:hypothetical protein BDZ89DRAFT_1139040 [Hymenopellis radicata]|nr:hypothetical protein BDZ89DRAFT_1139040 [Hymenopellis radicata]